MKGREKMYEGAVYSLAQYLGSGRYLLYLRRRGPGTELLGIYNGYISRDGNRMKCYIKSPAIGVRYRDIPGKSDILVRDIKREPDYI